MIKYTYIKVKGYQAIKKSQHYDDDGAGMNRRRQLRTDFIIDDFHKFGIYQKNCMIDLLVYHS